MGKPGREITIYDIAERLKVSAATVSRSLGNQPGVNKNTREKIVNAAHEMGYSFNAFASNLRTKRSNTIGVIVPRLNSNFMSDVIAGMEKVANDANYNIIISQSLETMSKEKSNAKTMYNNRVDGLLVSLAYNTTDIVHFDPFINRGIPVIFFDRVFQHDKCPGIHIDNFKAAYEITNHLIAEGCRKLVHITVPERQSVYIDRLQGFKKALADHSLPFSQKQIIETDMSVQGGTNAAMKIMDMAELPDGIFAANDITAITCLLEFKKRGIKIPGEIAIAGFNNDPSACIVEPQLTTINYKGFEMGEVAARLLISHLLQNYDLQLTHSLILRHEIIIRESSSKSKVMQYLQ